MHFISERVSKWISCSSCCLSTSFVRSYSWSERIDPRILCIGHHWFRVGRTRATVVAVTCLATCGPKLKWVMIIYRATLDALIQHLSKCRPQKTWLYRVIHKSWNILKIRNKYTTHRIMIILTLIERETFQVFFKENPRAELPWFTARKQQYHRCCGSGRPRYTDTRVGWNGLSYRCLPCNQSWTHWASV
jgi:hypothetical protein